LFSFCFLYPFSFFSFLFLPFIFFPLPFSHPSSFLSFHPPFLHPFLWRRPEIPSKPGNSSLIVMLQSCWISWLSSPFLWQKSTYCFHSFPSLIYFMWEKVNSINDNNNNYFIMLCCSYLRASLVPQRSYKVTKVT
jgi:hypothetical protein